MAQTDDDASTLISVDEIAMELSNPVTAIRGMTWDIEGTKFQGNLPGADTSALKNTFTVSWPFKLKNDNNILIRLIVPVPSDQPLWELSDWDHSAEWRLRQRDNIRLEQGFMARGHDFLDDIEIDFGYGGVSDNGTIGMVGLAVVIPTSEDGTAERDQLLAGPEFVLGKVKDWGMYGARFKHLTDVHEDDVPGGYGAEFPWSTNESYLKFFYAYAMGNGWQFEMNPTILYDWEAIDGHEWTLPIGAGASKTMRLGRVPVKFTIDLQKYLLSPDRLGPDWQLTFSISPVFSTKLLR